MLMEHTQRNKSAEKKQNTKGMQVFCNFPAWFANWVEEFFHGILSLITGATKSS